MYNFAFSPSRVNIWRCLEEARDILRQDWSGRSLRRILAETTVAVIHRELGAERLKPNLQILTGDLFRSNSKALTDRLSYLNQLVKISINTAQTCLRTNSYQVHSALASIKYRNWRDDSNMTLPEEQVNDFMENGFCRIPGAFTPEQASEFTKDVWLRLGMNPDDQSTWDREWTNMPCTFSSTTETTWPRTSIVSVTSWDVQDLVLMRTGW